jgi:uncharacterized protein YkwD
MNMPRKLALTLTALAAGLALALVFALARPAAQTSADPNLDTEEQAFITLINNYRQANGLGPLAIDWEMQGSSDWMSNDMGVKAYFSHTDSLGRDPWTRMCAFGYCYNTWMGENIAAGYTTASDVFTAWKNSPGHNANMLGSNYVAMGISRVYVSGSPYGWYWTNDFGVQSNAAPAAAPTNTPAPAPTATPNSAPAITPSPNPSPSPSPSPTIHVTDVGVTVVKEEQITTQEGVTSTHVMTITVTNGNYPADVHLTVLAVSKLGVCEARLIAVGSDHYMEFQTDENNDGILDTLYSELDIDLTGMAVGEARTLHRSYSLVCNVANPPMNPYEIQADVLPQLPVQEANLGNPPPCPSPWCVPAVTGGPQTPSDNVHKNFPHVIIATSTPAPTPTASPSSGSGPTCPNGLVPPWPVPLGDPDCDGFTSAQEAFIGTDPTRACGPDAWPPDINGDGVTNISDVMSFATFFNSANVTPIYSARYDLNTDGRISLADILVMAPFFNKSCVP